MQRMNYTTYRWVKGERLTRKTEGKQVGRGNPAHNRAAQKQSGAKTPVQKPPAKIGRPTKFTPDVRRRILEAIRLGSTYDHAAAYGGLSDEGLRKWIRRGNDIAAQMEADEAFVPNDEEMAFVDFVDQLKQAEGAAVHGWLAKIEKAATEGNWQAAAWKLERRYPHVYGRTVQEHTGKDGAPIKIDADVSTLTDEQLDAIIARAAAQGLLS